MTLDPANVKYGPDGLVPVIAQDARSGDVLMLAWADKKALEETVRTGFMHYHSRSRGQLWKKGETSGHVQKLTALHADCDQDAILALVLQEGAACHTGADTCFSQTDPTLARAAVSGLAQTIKQRQRKPPAGSYTAKLFADANLRLKKLGEESIELVLALQGEGEARVASEAADLIYHIMVACQAAGVDWTRIAQELETRKK